MSSLLALTGGDLNACGGFRQDARFALTIAPSEPLPVPVEVEDPIALAWAEGFQKGLEHAHLEAEAARAAHGEAHAALDLALTRLDAEMQESLREKLQDTVMALCEATLVPYALDPEALAGRVQRAVAMFSRAEDERTLRLHPEDIALVSDRLQADWKVVPDPALARGALRVETTSGGVEDGPAEWRRALAEAFHAC
jgi:flagellar assembly protein FliH